ncbi:hypothetical protein ACRRTK_024235 [Alexandromys fortis]
MNSFVKEKLASQAKFVMPFAPVVLSAVLYTSIQVWVVIQGFGDRSYRPKDPRQSVQNLASSPSFAVLAQAPAKKPLFILWYISSPFILRQ